MASRIALILVVLQWLGIAIGTAYEPWVLLRQFFVYGSPLYLVTHIPEVAAALMRASLLSIAMVLFQVAKYFSFFKSRLNGEQEGAGVFAIILEAAYLAYAAYRLY